MPEVDQIEWKEPPEKTRKSRKSLHEAVRQELRKNPGKWAVVKRGYKSDAAKSMKMGQAWDGFELVSRRDENDEKTFVLYARFVG